MMRMRVWAGFEGLFDGLAQVFRFVSGMTAEALTHWADGRHGRPPLSFDLRRDPAPILNDYAQQLPDKGFLFRFPDLHGTPVNRTALT